MKTVSLCTFPDPPAFGVIVADDDSDSSKTWCRYSSKSWATRATKALERQGYRVLKDEPTATPKFSRENRPLTARPSRVNDIAKLQRHDAVEPRPEFDPFAGLFSDPRKFAD